MYTNSDMTLYSCDAGGKYTRSVIKKIFWQEVKQSNVIKSGIASADSVKIFIPVESVPNGLNATIIKNMVVKGTVDFEFDNTSPQTISTSLKELNKLYDVHSLSVFDGKLYGSYNMQHYQLSCK